MLKRAQKSISYFTAGAAAHRSASCFRNTLIRAAQLAPQAVTSDSPSRQTVSISVAAASLAAALLKSADLVRTGSALKTSV